MLDAIKKWFSKPAQINMSQDYYDGLKKNIDMLNSRVSELETKNAELKKTLVLKETGFRKILTGAKGQKEKRVISPERKKDNRTSAQKEIWANYTPAQREDRIAKMWASRRGVTIS
jgi:uncharacterized coiled-coil DUF342 family protein